MDLSKPKNARYYRPFEYGYILNNNPDKRNLVMPQETLARFVLRSFDALYGDRKTLKLFATRVEAPMG